MAGKNGRPADARRAAFDCLLKVELGAFASDSLIERTARLESRDAGLAAEITLGVLRRRGQLDWFIERFADRRTSKLDLPVLIALRLALYQVKFLDRVPSYAAVNDSLNLLKSVRKTSAVAFANAVLRKGVVDDAVPPLDRAVPPWLFKKWTGDFGAPVAQAIAGASLEVPRLYQHVPPGEPPPAGGKPTGVPGCWEVEKADPKYRVQDIGSQSIVPLLDIWSNHFFLDVCAAPGNKTAQARETTERVVANDVSFPRAREVHVEGALRVVSDAQHALPFGRRFDRILVDAPCTGTGTLAHNPEIKWRVTPEDIARAAERQKAILESSLEVLAPGGQLVYSTCSLEPEENEKVVRAVAWGRIEREIRRTPGRDAGDGFYAAVIR